MAFCNSGRTRDLSMLPKALDMSSWRKEDMGSCLWTHWSLCAMYVVPSLLPKACWWRRNRSSVSSRSA
eukprot:5839851-Amphidinium_carterae.1